MPPNFVGVQCDACADGFKGKNCVPSSLAGSSMKTLFSYLIILSIFGGVGYALFTKYGKGANAYMGDYYDKVPSSANWEDETQDAFGSERSGLAI